MAWHPPGSMRWNTDSGISYTATKRKGKLVEVCGKWENPGMEVFCEFENMTEEEAKALTAEAQPDEPTLFGKEE